ncbi:uncharacterized protein [Mytilus edulis]|uniref:uncharacterized protein n=1 Tax=Mytilus edulis TaxID=6550 RepID=UPI0039EE4368
MDAVHNVLFVIMVLACFYRFIDTYNSCADLYLVERPQSGYYTLYHDENPIEVYCSFEGNVGYTYISKFSNITSLNISELYTRKDLAKIRTMMSNGTQKEVTVGNINRSNLYFGQSNQNLIEGQDINDGNKKVWNFLQNNHTSYQGPNLGNVVTMSPYLFLGFLPISLAGINQSIQGYRAADTIFNFTNCDGQPNSYISFYYNPNNNTPVKLGSSTLFMTGWMDHSFELNDSKYMAQDFFFDFEMHMGGCGGFMTSDTDSVSYTTAALGLPFDKCEPLECCNEDDTGCCTSDDSNCTSTAVYVCANDNGMYNKRSESCNIDHRTCPEQWSEWANLGRCSVTCGQGIQHQTRNRFLFCAQINETDVGETDCYHTNCPVSKWDHLNSRNLTFEEKKKMMKNELVEIKANLTVDKQNTSAAVRRRTSAPDHRPSASSVGYFGISLLVLPLVLLVCADCTRCCQSKEKSSRKRICPSKSKT